MKAVKEKQKVIVGGWGEIDKCEDCGSENVGGVILEDKKEICNKCLKANYTEIKLNATKPFLSKFSLKSTSKYVDIIQNDKHYFLAKVKITLEPTSEFRNTLITVSQYVSIRDFTWEEATVNWPAIGSQDSIVTIRFANALLVASELVNDLNTRSGQPSREI